VIQRTDKCWLYHCLQKTAQYDNDLSHLQTSWWSSTIAAQKHFLLKTDVVQSSYKHRHGLQL